MDKTYNKKDMYIMLLAWEDLNDESVLEYYAGGNKASESLNFMTWAHDKKYLSNIKFNQYLEFYNEQELKKLEECFKPSIWECMTFAFKYKFALFNGFDNDDEYKKRKAMIVLADYVLYKNDIEDFIKFIYQTEEEPLDSPDELIIYREKVDEFITGFDEESEQLYNKLNKELLEFNL